MDLINNLIELLEYEKEEGRRTLEVNPETLRTLAAPAANPHISRAQSIRVKPSSTKMDFKSSEIQAELERIAERVAACTQCDLCKTRTNTVPGQGALRPDIMFIGEGPGADEDRQGLAFVGRAGQLLTKIIEAMGYTRETVFIGNIVKCRPPGNRTPYPDEMESCMPYLLEQIALLQPKVIVCLGATAVKGLFNTQMGISKLRGQWMTFEGIDTMPTYHPAYLLRNPSGKRDVWDDMKAVLEKLGKEIPPRGKS